MTGVGPDALEMPEWGAVPDPVGEPPSAGPAPPPGTGRRTQEAAVRQAVAEVARSQVGQHFGVGAATPYGRWYGPAWEKAYFCAAGWSWCWYQALGEEAARSTIGAQSHGGAAPLGRGFVWTVAILEQHRSRQVPLRDLQPGDALMFRYASGDVRAGNEVNHVDLVEVNRPDLGCVDVIGFNVAQPGAPAGSDPGRGGGVWRRRIPYDYRWVVAGLQMPAGTASAKALRAWPTIQHHLTALGLADLRGSGVVGPATRAGVAAYARTYAYRGDLDDPSALLTHLEETMSSIHEEIAALRGEVKALRKAVEKQSGVLGTIRDSVRRSALAKAVWDHSNKEHGPFDAWWFLRRGLVLNPEHRQYPADPDSPADLERETARAILGREIRPCTGALRDPDATD